MDKFVIIGILDTVSRIAVILFCIWILFFSTDYSHTLWTGVGYVVLLFIVMTVTNILFVGPIIFLPLIPVGWEWWWRDISLSDVSTIAWQVSISVFVIRLVLLLIVFVVSEE